MLILILMLLIGLAAAVWGFLMCFVPARWERLTEVITVADHWTVPAAKQLHPIVRFGNRAAGFVICVVGCWFVYIAASKIYLVFTGQAVIHSAIPSTGTTPDASTPVGNVFSLLVIALGVLMFLVPAKAMLVFERVWPATRSVSQSTAPKVGLVIRIVGAALAFLGVVFLVR